MGCDERFHVNRRINYIDIHALLHAKDQSTPVIMTSRQATPKLSDTSQEAHMARYKDISAVEKRFKELGEWLKEKSPECFSEQKQLDEGTQERVYWHYGLGSL